MVSVPYTIPRKIKNPLIQSIREFSISDLWAIKVVFGYHNIAVTEHLTCLFTRCIISIKDTYITISGAIQLQRAGQVKLFLISGLYVDFACSI